MNKEIIELLEKAETKLLCTDDRLRPLGDIQQALALLRPPECALCCDKKVVPRLYYEKVPCPDCQQPKDEAAKFFKQTKEQQPKAGEWTKIFRKFLNDPQSDVVQWEDMSQKACDIIDRAGAENKRLKKAIEDYGNNPAGFDWAVLEKIENQESINADLLEACEKALRFGLNPSLEKIVQAAIAKAHKAEEE